MSKNNTMVFSEMRPPVASHFGETPLRGKHVNKLIDLAQGEYADTNGFRLTKEQVVKNYTDDARMSDPNWNNRHHVTPSHFNRTNHTYYKVRINDLTMRRLHRCSLSFSNTSIKTSRTSRACYCTLSGSSTHMRRTR